MKKVIGFLSRFAFSILVVIYLFVAPSIILNKLLKEQDGLFINKNHTYHGVLDMWHIESFEGGSVSRSSWLQKRAQEFEKQNKGTYISITSMNLETAKINIQNGKKPSLISFSLGLGDELKDNLLEFTGKKVGLEQLVVSGKHNKKQLAMPYMLGGYCSFNLNSEIVLSGLNCENLTSLALAITKQTYHKNLSIFEQAYKLDGYMAYSNFTKGKADGFFGTQRDFYRINNRINNGSMQEGEFEYCSFTDLIQYISIYKGVNEETFNIAEKFIEYLLSEKVQDTLKDIDMFSVLDAPSKSSNIKFNNFENHVKTNLKTVNVFLSNEQINEIKNVSLDYLTKNTNDFISLNKYFIS